MNSIRIRRELRAIGRRLREWRMIAWALVSKQHPVDAHLIPVRRCNLACTYCNEFDDFSKAVPIDEMLRRVDRLAELGTSIITISGGEPLLHPELDLIIGRIRRRGLLAGMITNGYLLVPERIERLNRAGLDHLQISIDNVQPDEVSKKSLKVLDKKLQMLAQYAEFHVNINSVLGSPVRHPQDALVVARRAVELGLTSTVGHPARRRRPIATALRRNSRASFEEIMSFGKGSYARLNAFQHDIAKGREHEWRCRAGSRYLYICENGLVHYCSQQRGYPGIPLEKYTRAHIKYEYNTRKACAPRCTVSCVQQVAMLDNWRAPQKLEGFTPLVTLTARAGRPRTPLRRSPRLPGDQRSDGANLLSLAFQAADLPLDLRQNAPQDSGIVVGEAEPEEQFTQLQQHRLAALGLQVAYSVEHLNGTIEQVGQTLRGCGVGAMDTRSGGAPRDHSLPRTFVTADRHCLAEVHGWTAGRCWNAHQRVTVAHLLVRKPGLLRTEQQRGLQEGPAPRPALFNPGRDPGR